MAKESGLGAQLYLDQYDISNDTGSVGSISKAVNLLTMTGIDKSAIERRAGQLTGGISANVFWNPSNAHTALAAGARTDRIVSYYHRATLGAPVASLVCKQTTYAPNRDSTGLFTATTDTLSNAYWLDWGLALTAGMRTDTTATNGTGVDFANYGMPASFGLQAYLHVKAFTGTSATIKLQGSSDNGVGDAFADITGGSFTTVTAVGKERIQTSRTQAIERYMRVVTTGTFSNLVFAVQATVNIADYTI